MLTTTAMKSFIPSNEASIKIGNRPDLRGIPWQILLFQREDVVCWHDDEVVGIECYQHTFAESDETPDIKNLN